MRRFAAVLAAVLHVAVLLVLPASAQPPATALPTVAAFTAALAHDDGLFPLHHDARRGLLYLEVPRTGEDFLYQVSLPAGLGSNDIGLDRGQLGETTVVRFERAGGRLLLVAPNLAFRASSANAAERRAVRDAFAEGVLFAFPIVAEDAGGAVLVDALPFVLRDAHGVVQTLQRTGQGAFSLDAARSSLWMEGTKSFPKNTEMEGRLTFASANPGALVRSVAADAQAVTLRERHSFVELPPLSGPGSYAPRRYDPRGGFFSIAFADYSAPLGSPVQQRLLVRHRLEKRDPSAAVSEPVEPIVYYLDNGTPEPVRSALLDGARWWNGAFEAAGFRDAFRVEVLPDTADALDVRYTVIQWVHRSTRGWSYGASVVDPRTGEILKGHVSLGSLRVRQDYLLAEGLLAPYSGALPTAAADPMAAMALARIRQLSAHEVGHTLGLAHNFAASTRGRTSVMDYPAPLATLRADGSVSLDSAYAVGIGTWDRAAVRFGYGTPAAGQAEDAYLTAEVAAMRRAGLVYLSDRDHSGGVEPRTVQWDNGADVLSGLRADLAVRRAALDRFSDAAVRWGQPAAMVEEAFVPLYLRHRYAVAGAARLLGGQSYETAIRGDGTDARTRPVAASTQRAALALLLSTLTPDALRLPDVVRRLAPRPPGFEPTRESVPTRTGVAFDAFAPAEVAAALVVDELVRPDRAARLAAQRATFPETTPALPALADVYAEVTRALWKAPMPVSVEDAQIRRTVQGVWTDALVALALDPRAAPTVRAVAADESDRLAAWLTATATGAERAHRRYYASALRRALDRPLAPSSAPLASPLTPPPGAPIGSAEDGPAARHRARVAAGADLGAETDRDTP